MPPPSDVELNTAEVRSYNTGETPYIDKSDLPQYFLRFLQLAWLLELYDKDGNDLYPEIRRRAIQKNASGKHTDMVRYEYIKYLGYYCTESSEHNAEYNPWYIKNRYPELIDRYNIPLDEYPRRCVNLIAGWEEEKNEFSIMAKLHMSARKNTLLILWRLF